MELLLISIVSFVLIATATPSGVDFSLVGFAQDNPIGPTTGGAGKDSQTVTVSTVEALISAVAGPEPKIIYAEGNFNLTSRLKPDSNKSIIGSGKGALITGAGLTIANVTNVIVRNFHIQKIVGNDDITIQNSTRIWIDHNEFSSEFSVALGPDFFDGQLDIVRASDWITVSWNYFHDHWKSSLVGNSDTLRDIDTGHLHVTYHHNLWRNCGTRGPAGRFGHQHIFNNFFQDYLFQAIHSRSDNQILVEGNVFIGNTSTALTTHGLVIPEDSPNSGPGGDFEIDGFANLGVQNDFGNAIVNITQIGDFTKAPYEYNLTPLNEVTKTVEAGAGIGNI
ncbi:Pectate lyase A [Golovinomyces cichoracearum]|uniref:Pectate lyase A n=1 Tax=Golovinomyces cichoracearum TaxID=62708 RepID=A0A420HTT8_9PEZI|nr:Pectate lyase A [Golovinomyces cichoracearum]